MRQAVGQASLDHLHLGPFAARPSRVPPRAYLVDVADLVRLDVGVLPGPLSGDQLREGGEQPLDAYPGHVLELARDEGWRRRGGGGGGGGEEGKEGGDAAEFGD